ncbi:hypothetical protein [Streptomyces parvus]|uniref:hypothetical protein n=1 Tax=Streptomyces parvus TaxID=66428 RepID=UPI0021018F0B|nr:hypothetical protein [Streptomyces parvus]MCQ1582121.1 hypothetical protein [Streptomyces parvus]
MTWVLSTVISLLLRATGPLIRRGLPHLAMAAMAALVCGASLAAGRGLVCIALWSPAEEWPLATVLVGLLGAAVRLAALVGLLAVALLLPLAITADCLGRRPGADRDEHSTTIR